jgi:acyl-coenzyme A thioesterase PaaI-like protein
MNDRQTAGNSRDAATVAAGAVRRLTAAILNARVRGGAEPDVSETITRLASRLETLASDPRACITGRIGTSEGALTRSPVSGTRNPVAMPLRFQMTQEGISIARCVFPARYQGSPGILHAGVSGLVLDVAMATAIRAVGCPGVTAEMTLRYLRPTPLHREVTIRGRHMRTEGRKVWAQGMIEADGEQTVVCDGLFITKAIVP